MEYEVVIGMETHVELDTHSKMFCACSARFFGAEPNTNVCPVCLGMPGALPVINKRAVEFAMMVGLALNCRIARHTFWERKSYWYPDLPKGYQISQYQYPLAYDGWLDVDVRDLSTGNWSEESVRRRIRIRRAHLEEDTGKLIHVGDKSYVDYNRSGVPLLEIVTEPDIRSADEAYAYLSTLQQIVRYLGVSTGDMEKGAMRCEPNMSLRPKGSDAFGVKVEIKNLNSLRAVREAIAYEIRRQTALLERGEAVQQVTMGWDENRGVTVVQREKESAHDYRYFPEPDLPPLEVDEAWLEQVRRRVPELALARQDRYRRDYGLSAYDAVQLTGDRAVAEWFEQVVAAEPSEGSDRRALAKAAANWIQTEIFRLMKAGGIPLAEIASIKPTPRQLAELIGLVDRQVININTARQVFEEMFATGADARQIVEAKGLAQVSDVDALRQVVSDVIAAHPNQVQQYLSGQEKVFGFLVGQAMKATQGKGNAQLINRLLREALKS
ncbi:MAG: Asp-tRNA(Asn)/Glu-tRNA(Gln) amidotransferase subunit GatB [Thermoflexales bacterium]|nr:Asp-tRNA(Asn)/Glu-tRNA(Gln) amidotransferase subunit GatB [Thermoflexales bacterium]MDW8350547.1 Asp-tRNA(Asn)/Glu-tRNA(Gln) amidotransferase subunit GatB [Anaerolineae bacterium]